MQEEQGRRDTLNVREAFFCAHSQKRKGERDDAIVRSFSISHARKKKEK